MSVLKIVTSPYDSPNAASNLIHYINASAAFTGGLYIDPNHAIEQMEMVRSCFDQQSGSYVYHFIVSLSESESMQFSSAAELSVDAYNICDYFASEYQIVFAIHYKDDRWHIYFVMNRVSYRDGRKYRSNEYADYDLGCHIRTCCFVNNLRTYYGCRDTLDDYEL